MTTTSEFKLIPLAEIHESKHNPRKHFDGPALEQLADSIRKVGVLTPCLVRPNAKGFELAAGHRRYRASKAAGLELLPCLVRPMTDQEFLEVLTIENLQREDVHPLDEAAGYEALMAAPYKMPVEKIAERVGKSVKYIYDRVKLLALIPEGRSLFWSDKITAGHAILLARLTAADQKRCIDESDGLFRDERSLYEDPSEEAGKYEGLTAVSVRELDDWIKRHVRFDHKAADVMLFPDAVHAVTAASIEKRKIIEITHEYLASDDVRHARKDRVYGNRAWKRADGKLGSKTCDRAGLGVVVAGAGRGETFDVCINKEKCLVHWGPEIKAKTKAEKSAGATSRERLYAKQEAKRQAQEAEEAVLRQRWEQAVPSIREELAKAILKTPVKATGTFADLLIQQVRPWNANGKVMGMVPRGKTVEDLVRHLVWVMAHVDVQYHGRGKEVLSAFGLKPDQLLDKYAPVQKKAAVETPTKAAKPLKKKKAA